MEAAEWLCDTNSLLRIDVLFTFKMKWQLDTQAIGIERFSVNWLIYMEATEWLYDTNSLLRIDVLFTFKMKWQLDTQARICELRHKHRQLTG